MSLFFCLRDLIVRCHVLAYSTCTVCSPKSYRWDSRDPECSVATIPVKWSQMGWHATLQWCYCCHSNSADGSPIISVFPWTISRQLNNGIFCQKQLITAVFFGIASVQLFETQLRQTDGHKMPLCLVLMLWSKSTAKVTQCHSAELFYSCWIIICCRRDISQKVSCRQFQNALTSVPWSCWPRNFGRSGLHSCSFSILRSSGTSRPVFTQHMRLRTVNLCRSTCKYTPLPSPFYQPSSRWTSISQPSLNLFPTFVQDK